MELATVVPLLGSRDLVLVQVEVSLVTVCVGGSAGAVCLE